MRYLTDRKIVSGLGSARSGTEHFWAMKVSSAGLIVLIPLFLLTFGPMLGQPYEVVTAYYAKPFPALIAGLTLLVSFLHFKDGVRVLIEDYVHGPMQQLLIIATIWLSYACAAIALLAIARLAL